MSALADIIRLGVGPETEQAWQALGSLAAACDTLKGATNGDRTAAGRAVLEAAQVAAQAFRAAESEHAADLAAVDAYLADGDRRVTLPEEPQ